MSSSWLRFVANTNVSHGHNGLYELPQNLACPMVHVHRVQNFAWNNAPTSGPKCSCLSCLVQDGFVVLAPLQLGTLLLLQVQNVTRLVGQGRVGCVQVTDQLGQARRLQRGGMVRALPSAVLGE